MSFLKNMVGKVLGDKQKQPEHPPLRPIPPPVEEDGPRPKPPGEPLLQDPKKPMRQESAPPSQKPSAPEQPSQGPEQEGLEQRLERLRQKMPSKESIDTSSASPQPSKPAAHPQTPPQPTSPNAPPSSDPSAPHPQAPPRPVSPNVPPPSEPASGHDEHRANAVKRLLSDLQELREREWQQAPPFNLEDGSVLHNPSDLADAAKTMTQEVFSHHVTDDRNDFATWIRDAFADKELAARVRLASSPQELHDAINDPAPLPPLPEEDAHVPVPKTAAARHPPAPEPKPPVPSKTDHPPGIASPSTDEDDISVLATAYNEEINALREELLRLRTALAEEIAAGVESLRKEQEEHERIRDKLGKELTERETRLEKRQEALDVREAQVTREQERLEEQRSRAEAIIEESKSVQEDLSRREQAVTEAQRRLKQQADDIRQARHELSALNKEIEQGRIRARASRQEKPFFEPDTDTAGPSEPSAPKEQTSTPLIPDTHTPSAPSPDTGASTDSESIVSLVEKARSALQNADFDVARSVYGKVREAFYHADLPEEDKRELYNLIRELYTDIELASMR